MRIVSDRPEQSSISDEGDRIDIHAVVARVYPEGCGRGWVFVAHDGGTMAAIDATSGTVPGH